jgi:hypothetical protein
MIISNRTYLGNDKLRKADVKIEYSLEQLQEYAKCAEDPEYFIRNYVYIITDAKSEKFNLYPCQADLINHYNDNRFSILMAARQSGKCLKDSTYISIRNTKTGESKTITVGEFYELQRSKEQDMS